jgi:hypothetical protein
MTDDHVRALVQRPLRSRAMIAYALCLIAEEEIHAGRPIKACETINSVRRIVEDIWMQLGGDTSRMPIGDAREAEEVLCDVDQRLRAIEALFGSPTIH